jgi:hypothetical protein
MNRITMLRGVAIAAAFLFSLGSEALAQRPDTGVSMFCKTWAGGKGFALVTLSNLTTSTIPKGEALFASKGGTTIKFQAAEAIPDGGNTTYRTSAGAFQVEGPCDGWHSNLIHRAVAGRSTK